MAISEKKCLRIRVILYVMFALSYAIGVIIFIRDFNNYLAAFGFGMACFFIAVSTLLHAIPNKKLYNLLKPGSKSRIIFQSGVLIISLAFVGLSLYALARGIMLRQAWRGDSYFCSFIALLTAGKWCFFCGLRINGVRNQPIENEVNIDEKSSLFEIHPPEIEDGKNNNKII